MAIESALSVLARNGHDAVDAVFDAVSAGLYPQDMAKKGTPGKGFAQNCVARQVPAHYYCGQMIEAVHAVVSSHDWKGHAESPEVKGTSEESDWLINSGIMARVDR
jgi:hypothetical protein